ncbi:MAG: ABC transporter ATP-binding protein [Gemmatimonadota bacterium]
MSKGGLELDGLRKRFGETRAVDGVDLQVEEGEFLTLLGPSGCGKTTVLRLVAGFERPDEGEVWFGGEQVTRWTPQRRGFGMVFQHYALFPHLSVFENVAFGLRARRTPAERIRERVADSLARVDLEGRESRKVQELSGGQQQRVALARALAIQPRLLLLDEPLSNLDAALRERTRTELRALIKDLGITSLYVTHDQEEAFDLSDRVAVMRAGRLRQVGTPEELYERPADRFVASFVGRATVLAATLETPGAEGELVGRLPDGTGWRLPAASLAPEPPPIGAAIELYLRPEALVLRLAAAGEGVLRGRVRDRRFRGALTTYRIEIPGEGLLEVSGEAGLAEVGDTVGVGVRPGARIHAFPAAEP